MSNEFVPALRFSVLTRLYDRVIAATMEEDAHRRALLAQAGLRPGHRVLDLGCGTGTFALLAKTSIPGATVIGLDADEEALELARAKARAQRVDVAFQRGFADEARFEDASFDRVTSMLLFHHLTRAKKVRTLERARQILRPGGELHVADWGRPHDCIMRAAFLGVRILDGFETTADNIDGALPALMQRAGFLDVAETRRERTIFGTLSMYRAVAS
jgi:ubiquinone/menaquinone biosynthesis C-methylase UbiE